MCISFIFITKDIHGESQIEEEKWFFLEDEAYFQRSRYVYFCSSLPQCLSRVTLSGEGRILDKFSKHYHPLKEYMKGHFERFILLWGNLEGCQNKLKIYNGNLKLL